MANATTVTVEDKGSGFEQKISARRHEWSADEPLEVEGTDLGPTPYELLLGALGSCVAITVRMYARRKQWPVEGIAVKLRHSKIHAQDCDDCDQEKGFVDLIDKEVSIKGDLSSEQIRRLAEIAERCPVQKTLTGNVKIRTRQG